jgi:branched-chain amino acid aminotransferase
MSRLRINGVLVEKLDARISPFDHGFLYGDGVWEALRVWGGRLILAAEHLDSLFTSAETLGIRIPHTRDELVSDITDTLVANNRTEGYVRIIITRGPGTIGPDPRKLDTQVVIISEEYQPFPQELYGHGLHTVVFPVPMDTRHPLSAVRVLGQPHMVLAKQHALRHGCLDAILTNHAGSLVGTTEGFLFLVKDGAVVVAGEQPRDATGYAVASAAGSHGKVVVEYAVKAEDAYAADEVFIAGTACGVIGLTRIDGREIGSGTEGPITKRLRELYRELLLGMPRT